MSPSEGRAPMNILFVTGPGRSGTSAFTNYMNWHPEVMIATERYKQKPIRPYITPGLFTFDRILDYREGETNRPKENYERLLEKNDPRKLKWIGDKAPGYIKIIRTLSMNNPGSRFVIMYRPIEEVVESYVARSHDPHDPWLGGKDGFEIGLIDWNVAMNNTRDFVEAGMGRRTLIIDYHDFFERNETCIPLVSRFLGIEFDDRIRDVWRRLTRNFEKERRSKDYLSEEQKATLQKRKDHAAEEWVLDRIQKQWDEVAAEERDGASDRDVQEGWREVAEELMRMEVAAQTARSRRLERRIEKLEEKVRPERERLSLVRNPAARKLLARLDRVRAKVMGKR